MSEFEHIDLNNCILISPEAYDFVAFLSEIGLRERYVYDMGNDRAITGYGNAAVCDIKIEIFSVGVNSYIRSVISKDLNIEFSNSNYNLMKGKTAAMAAVSIAYKLAMFFKLESSADLMLYISDLLGTGEVKYDEEEDVIIDQIDEEIEDSYEYEEYVFMFFDDYRAHGPKNSILADSDHIRTVVLSEMLLCIGDDGNGYVTPSESEDDAVVGDMYRVSSDIINKIQRELPYGVTKTKLPNTDVWYFYPSEDIDFEIHAVEKINATKDEKYADCDYSDWLDYQQTAKYDIIDTFSAPGKITPASGTLTSPDITTSDDVYTRAQYEMILAAYGEYCNDTKAATGNTIEIDDDVAFTNWFISDAAIDVRSSLEEK